ncbi:MAG: HAMP domain-containing histidine kinase [Myxococcales bacterium]|nr:HAMP domain-containing histidine kinase [Myxococcales bacterium]
MSAAESTPKPRPSLASRAMPSLRVRFLLLLTALAALALAPWVVAEHLRVNTDGFAVALQDAGSLRFRLLEILTELPQARQDAGTRRRVETLMQEQRTLLDDALRGEPAKRAAACPTPAVCARLEVHLRTWDTDIHPRFVAYLNGSPQPLDALSRDVLLEVNELDLTIRATARAVESRTKDSARLGVWASVVSVLLVMLVAAGIWQVFARIQALSALVGGSADTNLNKAQASTDELDALAEALASGLAAEREQRLTEARRAEELSLQQLATHQVADSLSAWIAGESSLDGALAEVARATGHQHAELVSHSDREAVWRSKHLAWAGTDLGTLRLGGPGAAAHESDEILLDTLSQIFAIACLADRLLAQKTAQGRLAIALGGLVTNPDAAELARSLGNLIAHDAALVELFDASGRLEDTWAVHGEQLTRLAPASEARIPSKVSAFSEDSSEGCAVLRQRSPGAQLAIPLEVEKTVIGAIHLARTTGEFSRQELRAAEALAPVAASALARVQLEARLRFAEQWSTMGAFGRLLAHEIKNPLNSLSLELALLERRVRKLVLPTADLERLDSSVQVVKSELARLTGLTNEYLSMSPKTGQLSVLPVDLHEIVTSVARAHSASITDRGIRLVDELGPGPAMVLGHPDKLKQLVHNLIGNAIEAMASADLRVATLTIQRRDDHYELRVRDTGPGISDPVAIFSPGYTTKPSGTGMGLAISQQIARQHGGRLMARALDTGGAEFTLSLAVHDLPPNSTH